MIRSIMAPSIRRIRIAEFSTMILSIMIKKCDIQNNKNL
jgi:hypothetical protein